MFLWDFVADKVMGQIVDWIYSKLLEFLGEFFGMMGSMGADLFDYDFVRAIIELFRLFGWALFVSGMVVAVFEIAVEYQSGRGSIKDACLNAMKGFMAVSLFTVLPVELYKFCISLQVTMSNGLAKLVRHLCQGDGARADRHRQGEKAGATRHLRGHEARGAPSAHQHERDGRHEQHRVSAVPRRQVGTPRDGDYRPRCGAGVPRSAARAGGQAEGHHR